MSTIKKIAEIAQVSTATVSRAINSPNRVSEATLRAIHHAMEVTGYDVRGNKRLQINQTCNEIGLIVSDIRSPFFGLLSAGVEKIARQQEKTVLIASSSYDASNEERLLKHFLSKGVQHIIVHSKLLDDKTLIRYARKNPQLVVINRYIPEIKNQCVWQDNLYGGYCATKHLIDQGHREIAYVGFNRDIGDSNERFAGYSQALKEAGIPVRQHYIEMAENDEQSIARSAINIINQAQRVSAIVAYNDFFAASIMQTVEQHGLKVPSDISIVGFDNVLPQCYFKPGLTTIHSPIDSMAMSATRMALGISENAPETLNGFKPLLVSRESTAPPSFVTP